MLIDWTQFSQVKKEEFIRRVDKDEVVCVLPKFEVPEEPVVTTWDDIRKREDYGSIVRNNLMYEEGYSPYCAAQRKCPFNWPRMSFTGEQFKCRCGYVTEFPKAFIKLYKEKWKN